MDGGGVLYDTKDPHRVARLMEAILDDERLVDDVLAAQDAALDRLRRRDFAGTLLRYVDGVWDRPPRPAPDVAWDFWSQFEQFERLEELRQFRPALYKALPEQPGGRGIGGSGDRDPHAATPGTPIPRPADPPIPRSPDPPIPRS